jgi:3-dehydroquinate synthetase
MTVTRVLIRAGLLRDLPAELPDAPQRFVVTDRNVERLLPPSLAGLPRHVLPPGEASKDWATLGELLEALAGAGLQRDAQLLAVGGGVVTDLGGLAASLHRRGIRWCAVPTTLVGQVDAAFGGKTAVNLGAGKNSVGTFHVPDAVLIDPGALASLPVPELRAGLGEVLKSAVLSGEALLADVESVAPAELAAGGARAASLVERCLAVKQVLVARDPFDEDARQLLNLGHTFGHAFEALSLRDARGARDVRGGGELHARGLRHGEAVGLGLLCAARLAVLCGGAPGLEARLSAALRRWELPVTAAWATDEVLAALVHDKKRRADGQLFVLPEAPGRVRMLRAPQERFVRAALEAVAPRG